MKENQGMELDQEAVGAFIGQIQQAMMGSATMAMAHLGDRLGLYAALAEAGAATPAELADAPGRQDARRPLDGATSAGSTAPNRRIDAIAPLFYGSRRTCRGVGTVCPLTGSERS